MSEQEGPTASDAALPICAGCGIIVNAQDQGCAVCTTPYPARPPRALPQPGGCYWAGIRVTLKCRSCGFQVAVDHLAMDGSVGCNACGVQQQFDPSWWRPLIVDAQSIADVARGDLELERMHGKGLPEVIRVIADLGRGDLDIGRIRGNGLPRMGREILALGRTATFSHSREGGVFDDPERTIEASPGNPLCASCRAPVVVVERTKELLTTACVGCDAQRRYQIPAGVSAFPGLAAIVSDAHDADRPDARVEEQDGTVLLRCPGCGAPLENVSDAATIITCTYCNAACRVSLRVHQRAGHAARPPATWWLLFCEPSPLRAPVEAAIGRGQRAQRQRQAQKQAAAAQAAAAPASPPKRPPSKKVKRPALVLLVFAAALVLGGVLSYLALVD